MPRLTADDLIGLGVTSIGHRRKLLDAIAVLSGQWFPGWAARSGAAPEIRRQTFSIGLEAEAEVPAQCIVENQADELAQAAQYQPAPCSPP